MAKKKGVPAPEYAKAPVKTFTKEEIEALLKVCEYCREARTDQRRKFTIRRPAARRDRAIILTLLDTGLRAGELCSLRIGDVDLKTGKVTVRHGALGGSKGGKGRTVLRSGGDLFTLKSLLGHSSLEMVKHYARIAEVDIEQAHRRASPAHNWRL